jgi:hypothetical protein
MVALRIAVIAHILAASAFRLLIAEPGANLVTRPVEEAAISIVVAPGIAAIIGPASLSRSILIRPIVEAIAAIIAGVAAAAIISVIAIGTGAIVIPAIPAAIRSAALGLSVAAIASVGPIAALIALVTHRNLLHFS